MELLAKRRQDRLLLSLKTNAKIKRKMDAFWSGIEDPEADPEAAARDDSDLTLNANNITKQFEANVFHLFRNNLQNAQTLIGAFRPTEYARFNAVFPKLMERFYGNPMLDVPSVYAGAKALMAKHQPNPRRPPQTNAGRDQTPPQTPLSPPRPSTPTSSYKPLPIVYSSSRTPTRHVSQDAPKPPMSQAAPSFYSSFPTLYDDDHMDCPVPGCNSVFLRSGERSHYKTEKHQAAVRAQMRGKTPEKKDWKNRK